MTALGDLTIAEEDLEDCAAAWWAAECDRSDLIVGACSSCRVGLDDDVATALTELQTAALVFADAHAAFLADRESAAKALLARWRLVPQRPWEAPGFDQLAREQGYGYVSAEVPE